MIVGLHIYIICSTPYHSSLFSSTCVNRSSFCFWQLDKAKHESRSKDESLKKLEESLRSIESKGREKEQVSKSQQDEIKELKAQLELKTSLHCQSEKQILHISDRLKGSEETCATLQQKVALLSSFV